MNEGIRRVEWHPKGWGGELWLANNERYCGKLMFLEPGKRCSIHYHQLKLEDFAVLAGRMQLDLYPDVPVIGDPSSYTDERRQRLLLGPGDAIQIPQRTPHQFVGIERTLFIETSTQHFEADSYRVIVGDVLQDGEKASTPEFLVSIAKMLPW